MTQKNLITIHEKPCVEGRSSWTGLLRASLFISFLLFPKIHNRIKREE